MSFPELGTIVAGRYRLLRRLGEGGMATVFEVENTLTYKRAALKWVHPRFSDPERGLARVVHEARASSRIHHENVVNVYDVIEDGDSIFLVMELLEGEPLSTMLERAAPPMHDLVALLLPALRGLSAAHAVGVVHRDVKPDNIFLALVPGYRGPVPKVIDFGISKMFAGSGSHVTRSGVTMGTPRYVSYEQLLGARDVDARTDIYAAGVILYEALTGQPPYPDAHTFGEQAVCFATQEPLSARTLRAEIPEALDAVVMRAIAKQPDTRHGSMDELISELEPFADAARYELGLLALSSASAASKETRLDVPASTPGKRPRTQHATDAPRHERVPVSSRSSLPAGPEKRRYLLAGLGLLVLAAPVLVLRERAQTRPVATSDAVPSVRPAAVSTASEPVRVSDAGASVPPVVEVEQASMAEPPRVRARPAKRRAAVQRGSANVPKALFGKRQVEPGSDAEVPAQASKSDVLHRAGHLNPSEF